MSPASAAVATTGGWDELSCDDSAVDTPALLLYELANCVGDDEAVGIVGPSEPVPETTPVGSRASLVTSIAWLLDKKFALIIEEDWAAVAGDGVVTDCVEDVPVVGAGELVTMDTTEDSDGGMAGQDVNATSME